MAQKNLPKTEVSRFDVYDAIDNSKEIVFAWNQKQDFIGHTGVVLILDQRPLYTIDFGGTLTYCNANLTTTTGLQKSLQTVAAAILVPVEGGIATNTFSDAESHIKGSIIKLIIVTKKQKDLVKNLTKELLDVNMGNYKLLQNNCRSFVKRANELIIEFWKINQEYFDDINSEEVNRQVGEDQIKFYEEIDGVERKDSEKAITAAVVGTATVTFVAAAVYKLFVGDSTKEIDEDNEQINEGNAKTQNKISENCRNF